MRPMYGNDKNCQETIFVSYVATEARNEKIKFYVVIQTTKKTSYSQEVSIYQKFQENVSSETSMQWQELPIC